ncbi:hypothetical protein BDZ89DRAFT_1051197 [Hymenopellis radicata]|nr:hypothetical protein BDZ89DRAFT_1051197 [Hymenopellis radicata]
MSYKLEYIWQREKPYTRVPDYQYWRDIGGELIKAWDVARDKAHEAGESVARRWSLGDTTPTRVLKEKKTTKGPKPYDRKKPTPVVRARVTPRQAEQSKAQPPVIAPPPAAASTSYRPPTAFTIAAPQPVVVPMNYYQYNDPTCPIPEGDLPGPRSATLLAAWIAHQKAVKLMAE